MRGNLAIRASRDVQYEDQVQLFELGGEVLPGIQSVATTWHTVGHSAFEGSVPNPEDESGRFFFGGDAVLSSILGIENPSVKAAVDQSPHKGVRGRQRLVRTLARRGTRALFPRIRFPGLGNVGVKSAKRGTFRWWPAVLDV